MRVLWDAMGSISSGCYLLRCDIFGLWSKVPTPVEEQVRGRGNSTV
jgi:hypothetical protein